MLKLRIHNLLISLTLLSLLIASCEKKLDSIPKSEVLNLPSSTTSNLETILTDSGLVQLIMTTPLVEQYENIEKPYSEFRMGIKVFFFDGTRDTMAMVTSRYAKYVTADKLWELKDSVIVLDDKKVKLETELLYLSLEKDLIYTDRFVKLTDGDEIMTGLGFESDSHLKKKVIKKPWAIIYLNDEE
jgi:LPS export ABC transporter protein LptC